MWLDFFFLCFVTLMFSLMYSGSLHLTLFLILMISLIMSGMIYSSVSSWLAMMIILLYAGGLLILFFYLLSLCSNNKKQLNKSSMFLLFLVVLMSYYFNMAMSNEGGSNFNYSEFFIQDSFMNMSSFLLVALLLVLWSVTKVTLSCSGPLRPWF